MANPKRIPHKFQPWIDARKKYKLTHAHVQMARELGMNPKRFGALAGDKKEPWKVPLPQFIEELYHKRFGKMEPAEVLTMEQLAAAHLAKRAEKKAAKNQADEEE
jgi:hypothetical protein